MNYSVIAEFIIEFIQYADEADIRSFLEFLLHDKNLFSSEEDMYDSNSKEQTVKLTKTATSKEYKGIIKGKLINKLTMKSANSAYRLKITVEDKNGYKSQRIVSFKVIEVSPVSTPTANTGSTVTSTGGTATSTGGTSASSVSTTGTSGSSSTSTAPTSSHNGAHYHSHSFKYSYSGYSSSLGNYAVYTCSCGATSTLVRRTN